MNKKDVYKKALETWGEESQIIILFEEVAELQKELSKHLRGQGNKNHIAEEVADVEIMLEQMKLLFDIEDEVGQYKDKKINRLNDRVNEHILRTRPIKQEPIENKSKENPVTLYRKIGI